MDSILEEVRDMHEQRDSIEMKIVDEMLDKKTGHKDRLDSEHRQKVLLDSYMSISKKLLNVYEKTNSDPNLLNPPLTSPTETSDMSSIFTQFYLSLRKIKEISDDQPIDQTVLLLTVPEQDEILETDQEQPTQTLEIPKPTVDVDFTDEEAYGRYLDLNKCHEAFLQVIKREEVKPNYLAFLDKFDRFFDIDRDLKLTSTYKTYCEMMLEYFRDYSRRAKPLFDYESLESKAQQEFLTQWNDKTFPGWFTDDDKSKKNSEPMIDLMSYDSHEQLMELGLDCLKNELQVRGLKCGGTLEERAKRLWSVRGLAPEQIDDSLRASVITGKKGKKKSTIEPFTIASMEAKLTMYADYYNEHRIATIENVQRKQARTAEERNESDEDISDIEDEEEDQGDVIYNPKNLPIGWDDKPIPYWLYKLHGLNLTFTCEICGNATYKGPKAFQRHFVDSKHSLGMRCLGIPNTSHFANITKIEDAVKLWEKLKSERQKDVFQPQVEEEFEDSQGNVVTKKTYEDLKRQGLL